MRRPVVVALSLSAALALPLAAQDKKADASAPVAAPVAAPAAPAVAVANPALAGMRPIWGRVKDIVARAAEKMPEDQYGFKPTPEVRSFGQVVAHVVDSQNWFCKMAMGEQGKYSDETEKNKTTKADLAAALKDSIANCDKVFALTDADLAKPMKLFGTDSTRFAAATLIVAHGFEHYGNMVTYMRMKGIVPPSSEPPPAKKDAAAEKKDAPPAEKK